MVLKIEPLGSEEVARLIDALLSEKVYPLVASRGIPKKGGQRFYVDELGTLGIEKTLAAGDKHYFVLSIPEKTFREKIGNDKTDSLQARVDEIYRGTVVYAPRPSRDLGKEDRHFVEIRFPIDTLKLLSRENIEKALVNYLIKKQGYEPKAGSYPLGEKFSMMISKSILEEHIVKTAKDCVTGIIGLLEAKQVYPE